jgi:hypothetical protein
MRGRGWLAAGVSAAATAGCGAVPAFAESGRLADFTLRLTSRSPGSPTGIVLRDAFHAANDPSAKPSALRSAVYQGPSGLRFDSSAVSQCTASDDQIRLLGSNACPAASQLAVGSFSAITGFGPPLDPAPGDNHVFDGQNQLIEIITFKATPLSPAFDRLTMAGSTLTAHPPKAPGGPPDGETVVRSIDFQIPVRTVGGRSLITTPPDCPPDGEWTSWGRFTFADGSSDAVVSRTPCTQAKPALRLAVRPRRVQAGRRTRLRFRVSSTAGRCVSHSSVRIGGRAVRTDRHGRATLRTIFRQPGVRTARATHPGCLRTTGLVRVGADRDS